MKFLILFPFLCLSFFLFGQEVGSVSGTCVDQKGRGIENVQVFNLSTSSFLSYSNEKGDFSFELEANKKIKILFKLDSLEVKETFFLKPNEKLQSKNIVFTINQLLTVEIQQESDEGYKIQKLPKLDLQKLPSSSVEKTLIYSTAASSNNELTSNYNVRGGNFDENLVYVNDFIINRPFLTRSGQQEGLSFINSALVENIKFSGGGFESRYGDKLSSVLDITYKTPDSLNASIMASLLGVESHVAHKVNARVNYLAGVRYRSNGYFLNSLPTKGSYNPVFIDAQALVNVSLTENLTWSTILHYSSNNYRFSPETQETDFGTVNEAYRLKIYFDGQERTKFLTTTYGTALKWKVNNKLNLDLFSSVFQTDENETYDIQGQYFINLLESDPSKEQYGDSIATLGVGTFLNHARNRLKATIFNVYHNGSYKFNSKSKLLWGASIQRDYFQDVLNEWKMIDSAGYSLPQSNNGEIDLFETIKSNLSLSVNKYVSFLQFNTEWGRSKSNYLVHVKQYKNSKLKRTIIHHYDTLKMSYNRFVFNFGVRTGYTDANNETYITPRMLFVFFPRSYFYNDQRIRKRNSLFRISTGLYYQPPFYREFRNFQGNLNLNVLAQKSLHLVGGYEFLFSMWERKTPFKLTSEVYYKYMWDVNTYEVDNVRTRYYANNTATAYAYGFDLNLHGEFVDGVESFFKIGLLSTKEDVQNDSYTLYYNKAGERIYFGVSEDQVVVDSNVVHPKYIPRPTDQLMNFAILFQDNMPSNERFSAQVGVYFGSRLPYGPPDFQRYKDTLRQKSYFRTDLGLSYDLINKKKVNSSGLKNKRKLSDAIISFEVFNLMGINNVLSKQWIQDVSGKYYSIPNYLTQRRFNLKLILRI